MSTTAHTPLETAASAATSRDIRLPQRWFRVWTQSPARSGWILAWVVIAGGILRFATLSEQSFSADESFTVHLSRLSFGGMLHELPITEATPPLHYVLVWLWARVFGTQEAGMRSLSALAGTLTILALYGVVMRIAGRRAGLIAAGLASLSPFLVYYSQEARAYALLVLLVTVSLYFFVRVLEDPTPKLYAAWSASAALALLTHYFAIFSVAPEAIWLIYRVRPLRPGILAVLVPVGTEIALAPLAYAQRHPSFGWATKYAQVNSPLATRIAKIPRELLLGYEIPLGVPLTILLLLLCLIGAWWALRLTDRQARRGTWMLMAVAACTFGVPIVAGLIPALDLVFTRNFIAGLVAVLAIVAIGFSRGRGGAWLATLFAAVSLAMVLAVDLDTNYQRPDIRGAVRALGALKGSRAMILTGETTLAAQIYLRGAQVAAGDEVAKLREIDVIAMPISGQVHPPTLATIRSPVAGFTEVERRVGSRFTILSFRSAVPRPVRFESLIPGVSWGGWTPADGASPPSVGILVQVGRGQTAL